MRPLAGLWAGQGPARGNAAAQTKQARSAKCPGQGTHGNVSRPWYRLLGMHRSSSGVAGSADARSGHKVDTPAGPVAVGGRACNAVVNVRSEARTSDGWQSDDDM